MTKVSLPVVKPGIPANGECVGCGNCCSQLPGSFSPDDFESVTLDGVVDLLESGRAIVDWWEGDPRDGKDEVYAGYFLRPRTVNDPPDRTSYGSWGGRCVHLKPDGCELPWNERPYGCRMLKPMEASDGRCEALHGSGKQDLAVAWAPYWDLLTEACELAEHAASNGASKEAPA